MGELKTKPTDHDPVAFLNQIEDGRKRADAFRIHGLMEKVTGEKGEMWGPSILGYGRYQYVYKSGRKGEWMLTGFAPRKQAFTLYIMSGFGHYGDLLSRLGKHKTGKGCLYIKKLEDVNVEALTQLIRSSVQFLKTKKWP